jgi:hypothetical protein
MRIVSNSWRESSFRLGVSSKKVIALIFTKFPAKGFACSRLIYAKFIAGDGNFRLHRHNKGDGETADPSLFGDGAFYAPNEEYKNFWRVRGGAPDDVSVSFFSCFRMSLILEAIGYRLSWDSGWRSLTPSTNAESAHHGDNFP